MSGQATLVRQWILLKLLCARDGGMHVEELATEMEVSQKTIRRDLATFDTVGFPLEVNRGAHGRKSYRLESGWGQPDLAFTFDEALALYLGRKFLQPLAGTLVWEAAERAFTKIKASLGSSVLRYLDRIGGAFHETSFGVSDYSDHGEIIDSLLIGIEDRKVVWITYQSQQATEPVTYDIHPYRLTRHQGSLYLIGLKAEEEELRTWRVDRIDQAELERVHYTRPANLDLDAYFAGSFGIHDGSDSIHVRIRFQSNRARFVAEKHWHQSQRLSRQRDGSLIAEFEVSSTVEIKSWILSFGPDVEVLEPESLRREICYDLQNTVVQYAAAERPPNAVRSAAQRSDRTYPAKRTRPV